MYTLYSRLVLTILLATYRWRHPHLPLTTPLLHLLPLSLWVLPLPLLPPSHNHYRHLKCLNQSLRRISGVLFLGPSRWVRCCKANRLMDESYSNLHYSLYIPPTTPRIHTHTLTHIHIPRIHTHSSPHTHNTTMLSHTHTHNDHIGMNLRKVERTAEEKTTDTYGQDVASILKRRIAMEMSDTESESDSDSDDDDWN